MDVRVKAEPEAHIIGLNNGMQYVPYESLTQYQQVMLPNGVEPPLYPYPINGYDTQQLYYQHQPHQQQQQHQHQHQHQPNTEENPHHSAYDQYCTYEEVDPNQKYEYHEPDENFISIDDAKVRSFLLDLLAKEKQKKKEEEELEARRKLELKNEQNKSTEPIESVVDATNESDESTMHDVEYDEDGEIVLLDSDVDYIDENEEGIELNWIDLEQKAQKQSIECFLCGKSVVSSYNLRRHMMIHTGKYHTYYLMY